MEEGGGKGVGRNVPPTNLFPGIRGTVGARRKPAFSRPSKFFAGRTRLLCLIGQHFTRGPVFCGYFAGRGIIRGMLEMLLILQIRILEE